MSRSVLNCSFICLGLTIVFFLGGCGGNNIPTASVSGRVTMDGKPLDNVSVTFQPSDATGKNTGGGSFGKTDKDGRYTLEFVASGDPGAVLGMHRVTIVTLQSQEVQQDDVVQFQDPIPARYNFASTLTFAVPAAGTNEADFNLTSGADASSADSSGDVE